MIDKNDLYNTDRKIIYIVWSNIIMSNHISGDVDALVWGRVREKLVADFKNYVKLSLQNMIKGK